MTSYTEIADLKQKFPAVASKLDIPSAIISPEMNLWNGHELLKVNE